MREVCDGFAVVGSLACGAADAAGGVASGATGSVLSAMGETFGNAAGAVLDAVFGLISSATTVDVGAGYVTSNAATLASIASVVVVGLFVVQVVGAAVRREPGGLGRAVVGAGVAVLGAAAAGTVTQSLLAVVDGLCDGIAAVAGTSIEAAARRLLDVSLLLGLSATGGGAALLLVFGLLFIVGGMLTLGTLLVREALVVVAVVVAPLALAGSASRWTSGWVRRWVQVTLALILSKLAIVVVFVVAVGMLGDTGGLGGLLSGLILLLLACLAPWACFKVLDFAGTAVATEWHRATSGTAVAAANQGRVTAMSLMRTVAPVVGHGAHSALAAGAAVGGAAAGAATGASPAGAASGASSAAAASFPSPPASSQWVQQAPGESSPTGGSLPQPSPQAGSAPAEPPAAPTPREEPRRRPGAAGPDLPPPAGWAGEGR
jgi:hypothetical protein